MNLRILVIIALVAPTRAFATAGRVVVHFTGTVSSIDDPVGVFSAFSVGDPVSGEYAYDASTQDRDSDPAHGDYVMSTPLNRLVTTVGATEFTPTETSALFVDVTNNATVPSGGDAFTLQISVVNPPGCAATGSYLIFRDESGTAISNDALPTLAPDFVAFPSHRGFVTSVLCGENQDSPVLRFDVDSVTTVQSPIPAVGVWGLVLTTLALAAAGTCILRRRWCCG